MAKPPNAAQPQLTPAPKPAQAPLRSSSKNTFLPETITKDDFFRLKRQGIGWVVEMVRVSPEHRRETIWAEDLAPSAERRMVSLAMDAARTI
jgi:hypothetical protein